MTTAYETIVSLLVRRATPLGVHALKLRWLKETLASGLRRPDAAWFVLTPATTATEVRATLTACVYFGLSLRGWAELVRQPLPGGIVRWFDDEPGRVPALVLISRPFVPAAPLLNRYRVLIPEITSLTAPYSKIASAGRRVPPRQLRHVIAPSSSQLRSAEARATVAALPTPAPGRRPVVKCSVDDTIASPLAADVTRGAFALFCRELADELAASIASALAVGERASPIHL